MVLSKRCHSRMVRNMVHLANGAWLALVLIGIPAATSLQVGRVQLSSAPQTQMLVLAGLTLGAGGNVLTALWRGRRDKMARLCWKWGIGFGLLLLVQFLYFNGYIHFRWLKEALVWLKRRGQ